MEPEASLSSSQEPANLSQINQLHITVFVICCMFEFYGRPQRDVFAYLSNGIAQTRCLHAADSLLRHW